MEQAIEGITRKPGSGVACMPRGRFWGHDARGSMRELLLDAHISIVAWKGAPFGPRYVPCYRVAASNRIAGFLRSKFDPEAVTQRATAGQRSVFSPSPLESVCRQCAPAASPHTERVNAVSRSCAALCSLWDCAAAVRDRV